MCKEPFSAESGLPALLAPGGPPLKKLKLHRIGLSKTPMALFESLFNHPTLQSLELNIDKLETGRLGNNHFLPNEEVKLPEVPTNQTLRKLKIRSFRKLVLTTQWVTFISQFGAGLEELKLSNVQFSQTTSSVMSAAGAVKPANA